MKLVLTKKELIELGNIALTSHHLTGACLTCIGKGNELDIDTLSKTDEEMIEEIIEMVKEDIEKKGGYVKCSEANEYVVSLPESFTTEQFNKQNEIIRNCRMLIVKSFKFGFKYANTIKTLLSYIKASASIFTPLLETKDMIKDFKEIETEIKLAEIKINRILGGK